MKRWYLDRYLLLWCIFSCAADPDLSNAPGACRLDCNRPKIGSNDMRVRFLSPSQLSLNCNGATDTAYPLAVPIRFVIEKRRVTLPAGPSSSGSSTPAGTGGAGSAAGTGATSSSPAGDGWQPVSGISYHPLLLQGQGGVDNANSRDRFKGVMTPPEDWCTDSCGVGALDIKPLCRKAVNEMKLGIFSGSLSESVAITVNP